MKTQVMPQVRKPKYDLNSLKTHWFANNPFLTHFVNSMHVVFPEGEKFFIRSVKMFADKTDDPYLKERIKAFIGQEVQHLTQHRNFWDNLQKRSPAVEVFEHFFTKTAFEINETFMRKTELGNKFTLSFTAALEHYTAVLAEVALREDAKILEGMPEEMANLLKWHAAEEIEHRSVAFDLLKEVDDNYFLRTAGMVRATLGLAFYLVTGQLTFLAFDRDLKLQDIPHQFFQFVERAAPLLKTVAEHVGDYFRPDFHPDDNDNFHLAKDVFDTMAA
jgi:uncharacterized protein